MTDTIALPKPRQKHSSLRSSADHTQPKRALLVLGMHRSGTSSVAGVLVKLGAAAPGDLMPPSGENPRGFWESNRLQQLNDDALASAGTRWDDWRLVNAAWADSPEAELFRREALLALDAEFGEAPLCVIKDPRICRMMPFWTSVLAESRRDIRVVMPIRSPIEVARSLWARNRMPISQGLLLWLSHVLAAERESRHLRRTIIEWSSLLSDWKMTVAQIGARLEVEWPRWSDRTAAEIDEFLSLELRHNQATESELRTHPDVSNWVRDAYQAMVDLGADPANEAHLEKLDAIRLEFETASHVFGRALVNMEVSGARLSEELNCASADRDRLQAQQAESAARLDALTAERKLLASQLQAIAAERDQRQAEDAAAQARLQAAEAEKASLFNRIGALEESLEVADRQFEALRAEHNALLAARHDLSARLDDSHAQLQAMKSERDQLAAEPLGRFVRRRYFRKDLLGRPQTRP